MLNNRIEITWHDKLNVVGFRIYCSKRIYGVLRFSCITEFLSFRILWCVMVRSKWVASFMSVLLRWLMVFLAIKSFGISRQEIHRQTLIIKCNFDF